MRSNSMSMGHDAGTFPASADAEFCPLCPVALR